MKHKPPIGSKPIGNISSLSKLSLKAALYEDQAAKRNKSRQNEFGLKIGRKKDLNDTIHPEKLQRRISDDPALNSISIRKENESEKSHTRDAIYSLDQERVPSQTRKNNPTDADIIENDLDVKKSRTKLIEKSLIYDKIMKGKIEDKDDTRYNVNFTAKLFEGDDNDKSLNRPFGTSDIIRQLMDIIETSKADEYTENYFTNLDKSIQNDKVMERKRTERDKRMKLIEQKRIEWYKRREDALNLEKRKNAFE